ncbi:MAG: PilZ domain-containing protein [Gammaproteobacteria bacterium]|nr:PilZ domain-containing protein [Gammaproteobacteria bacterium]
MTNGNRRTSVRRAATKELWARFKPTGLFSFLKKYKECEVVDFYQRGLGFISSDDLDKYETVQLEITYRFKKCTDIQGIIVHKKLLGPRSFRYGLMFRDLDKTAQEKLQEIEAMLA